MTAGLYRPNTDQDRARWTWFGQLQGECGFPHWGHLHGTCWVQACPHWGHLHGTCWVQACPHWGHLHGTCWVQACPHWGHLHGTCWVQACPHWGHLHGTCWVQAYIAYRLATGEVPPQAEATMARWRNLPHQQKSSYIYIYQARVLIAESSDEISQHWCIF